MEKLWFIQIHRKILDWEWYDDINTKVLFLHILLKTNYKSKNWRWIEILEWEFITWREQLSKETWLSEQQIRTSLNKLKSTNEITIKTTNKYSIIKLINYNKYQNITNNITNNQPTDNQQVTTTNKDNNINKDNNTLDIYNCYRSKFSKKMNNKKLAIDRISKLLKIYTKDEIIKAIENYYKDKRQSISKWEWNFIKSADTFFWYEKWTKVEFINKYITEINKSSKLQDNWEISAWDYDYDFNI